MQQRRGKSAQKNNDCRLFLIRSPEICVQIKSKQPKTTTVSLDSSPSGQNTRFLPGARWKPASTAASFRTYMSLKQTWFKNNLRLVLRVHLKRWGSFQVQQQSPEPQLSLFEVSESMEVNERHILHIYPRIPRGRGIFLSEPTATIQ